MNTIDRVQLIYDDFSRWVANRLQLKKHVYHEVLEKWSLPVEVTVAKFRRMVPEYEEFTVLP